MNYYSKKIVNLQQNFIENMTIDFIKPFKLPSKFSVKVKFEENFFLLLNLEYIKKTPLKGLLYLKISLFQNIS